MKRVAVMLLWWMGLSGGLNAAGNSIPDEMIRGLFRDIAVIASFLIAVIGTATGALPGTKREPR